MAAILYRFTDGSSISDWAYEAVRYCQTAGILTSRAGNMFDPQAVSTRAVAATVFMRFIKVIAG